MTDNLEGADTDFPMKAKLCVLRNYNFHGIGTSRGTKVEPLSLDEVHVVWLEFVRGNWTALLSTSRPDSRIYKVSSAEDQGGAEVICVETYLKTHNTVIGEMTIMEYGIKPKES